MLKYIYPINAVKKISIMGAALGWGAQIHETEQGPDYLYKSLFRKKMNHYEPNLEWRDVLYPLKQKSDHLEVPTSEVLSLIKDFVSRLSEQVESVIREQHFPLIFGGDHSLAIGLGVVLFKL